MKQARQVTTLKSLEVGTALMPVSIAFQSQKFDATLFSWLRQKHSRRESMNTGQSRLAPSQREAWTSWSGNQLWNKLVEIHNDHSEYYDQARRDADEEYNTLRVELDNVEERVKKAHRKAKCSDEGSITRLGSPSGQSR